MGLTVKKNLDILIYEKLKEDVIDSRWKAGQLISIEEIAERYGISRTPATQAVKLMAMEGIFSIRSNGRIEIPKFDRKQIRDICKTRLLIENFAIKTICEAKNATAIEHFRENSEQCVQQIRAHNILESRKFDLVLHRQLVVDSGNECLASSFVKVQGQFMTANFLTIDKSEPTQAMAGDEHAEMLECLAAFNYQRAAKLNRLHIMNGCERIVERIED